VKSSGPFKRSRSGLLFWFKANSVPEIDRAITLPLKGGKHSDLDAYYSDASALHQLGDGMKIPFLCITALNDPFIPKGVIPNKDVVGDNENVFIANTHLGGHIGKDYMLNADLGSLVYTLAKPSKCYFVGYWMPEMGCWATNAAISFLDSVRINAADIHKSIYVRQASSFDAAHALQRSSRTGLTNYFDFIDFDSCSDLHVLEQEKMHV